MSAATSPTRGGRAITHGPGELPAVAVSLTGPSLAHALTQARRAIDAGADVLDWLAQLRRNGTTVLMVTHDPDHAFFCSDFTLTMKDGCVLEHGPPRGVIREDSMHSIYRTPVRISDVDMGGGDRASVCVPVRTHRRS